MKTQPCLPWSRVQPRRSESTGLKAHLNAGLWARWAGVTGLHWSWRSPRQLRQGWVFGHQAGGLCPGPMDESLEDFSLHPPHHQDPQTDGLCHLALVGGLWGGLPRPHAANAAPHTPRRALTLTRCRASPLLQVCFRIFLKEIILTSKRTLWANTLSVLYL